ncbi:hypothetical protein ACWC4C_44820 [Streptomyces olivaceoviridis]
MRVAEIVGVHGIGQSRTSGAQLTRDWGKALGRGIKEFADHPDCSPTLRMPHWTSLLAKGTDRLGPQDDPYGALMTPAEEQSVADALGDVVGPQDLAYAEEQPLAVLGPPKLWPPRITRLLMAYDQLDVVVSGPRPHLDVLVRVPSRAHQHGTQSKDRIAANSFKG